MYRADCMRRSKAHQCIGERPQPATEASRALLILRLPKPACKQHQDRGLGNLLGGAQNVSGLPANLSFRNKGDADRADDGKQHGFRCFFQGQCRAGDH